MDPTLSGLAGQTILITGADGMLGRAFQNVLSESGVPCSVEACDHQALDVTDREAVMAHAAGRPNLILHCAANVDADDCERRQSACREVQVGGTSNVAALAAICGSRVFFPQSVFIFDGRELPVTEETTPSPGMAYGRWKLEAEQALCAALPQSLVVRMAGFFGGEEKDKNFVGKFTHLLRGMLQRDERRCEVGARIWQPTFTIDLAHNSLMLLARGCTGVYHMGALDEASFFDVARACVESLGLDRCIEVVRGAPESEVGEPARRPWRMVTANARLDREGLNRQRPWREALREYMARAYFDDLRRPSHHDTSAV